MKAYTINNLLATDEEISAELNWHSDHEIFSAHFPGHPVVPGALMLDLLSDVMSQCFKAQYYLSNAKRIKFLNVIHPHKNDPLQLKITFTKLEGHIKTAAVIRDKSLIYFKFSGNFAKS